MLKDPSSIEASQASFHKKYTNFLLLGMDLGIIGVRYSNAKSNLFVIQTLNLGKNFSISSLPKLRRKPSK